MSNRQDDNSVVHLALRFTTGAACVAGRCRTAVFVIFVSFVAKTGPPATLKRVHPDLTILKAADQLDRVLESSGERHVLLFKHSYSCGVSAEALDELLDHLNSRNHDLPVAMVTVQTHRELSNAVSAKLGIRHETPQALLIKDRKVVWSASHFRVTSDSVDQAIRLHVGAEALRQ